MGLIQPIQAAVSNVFNKVWAGRKIAPFTSKDLFSKSKHNEVLDAANCFLSPSVNPPTAGDVRLGPGGWQLDLSRLATAISTSGASYRGLYSASTPTYKYGDISYTGSTPAVRYFYVCEITNGTSTGAGAQAPDATETASPLYWRLIAAPGGVSRFQISSLSNADYITCAQWNGSSFTGSFAVAKPELIRPSLASEVIDSVTISYSGYTADNARTASDGTNTEAQKVYPRYRVNDIIYAAPVLSTGVVSVNWIEIKPARVWARDLYP